MNQETEAIWQLTASEIQFKSQFRVKSGLDSRSSWESDFPTTRLIRQISI